MPHHRDRPLIITRRGALGLAAIVPPAILAACANDRHRAASTTGAARRRSLSDHEADVVEEATARLIPGPTDDPTEAGHPGAREAGVTTYIDSMLGALAMSPPSVFLDGGAGLPITTAQHAAWTTRLRDVRARYRAGVLALDELTGGSFVDATPAQRDDALAKDPDGFTTLLFTHAIEGMYADPAYGGNAGGVGWTEIRFRGEVQPDGYSAGEVSESDGPDVYVRAGIGDKLLTLLAASTAR
ncbi:MAG: gluconate 2-dehydrogenase subunit 3 family protein [Acidimicrobiales bacterium]